MINEQGKLAAKALVTTPTKVAVKGLAAAGQMAAFPVTGAIAAAVPLVKNILTKKFFKAAGKVLQKSGKILRAAYGYAMAPPNVKADLQKYIWAFPALRIRLVNLWVLIYEDIAGIEEPEEPEEPGEFKEKAKYHVVFYSPLGVKLVRTTLSGSQLKEGIKTAKEAAAVPEPEKKKAPEKTESLTDMLNTIEEEILNEALGLPPTAALLARFKYKRLVGDAQLVRYRIWIIQIYDTARDITYIRVYDGVHAKQPIEKFDYEGKRDIL